MSKSRLSSGSCSISSSATTSRLLCLSGTEGITLVEQVMIYCLEPWRWKPYMKINFESVKVKLLPREDVHPRRPQPESGSPPPRKPGRRTFTLIHTYHWYYQMLRLFSNLEKKGDLTILLPWPQVRSRKWPLPRPPWSQWRSHHKFLLAPPKNQLINKGNVFVPGQPPSQGGEQHWGDGMAYTIQW